MMPPKFNIDSIRSSLKEKQGSASSSYDILKWNDRIDLDINNYRFKNIDADTVEISLEVDGRLFYRGHRIPALNIPYLKQDLNLDYSSIPLSGNPYIDTVIEGNGQFLGKGMDGIVFKVNDMVVKMSTTIPYHPFQHRHRTVEESIQHTKRESSVFTSLYGLVPCVPEVQYIDWGNRGWLIKPYLTLIDEDKISQQEFTQLEDCIKKMHDAGYAFGDILQIGRTQDGEVYFLDLGQAVNQEYQYFDTRKKDDESALRSIAKSNKLKMSDLKLLEEKFLTQSLGFTRALRNKSEDELFDLYFALSQTFYSLPPHLQEKHKSRLDSYEERAFSKGE